MGDAAKAVVGVALIATGLGAVGIGFMAGTSASLALGSALALSGSVAFVYGAVGVMALAGLSMLGGAVQLDIPDMPTVASYVGQKLQTRKTNTAPVPLVYGRNRLAGNIVWESTGNQISANSDAKGKNRDYWAVIALSGHRLNYILNMYANNELLTLEAGGWNVWSNSHVQVGHSTLYNATSYNLQTMFFPVSSSTQQDGLSLGFPDIDIPGGVDYICVHQIFDAENNANTQLKNISAEVYGKRCNIYNELGNIDYYAGQPTNVDIVIDILETQLQIPHEQIDFASFAAARDRLEASIDASMAQASITLVSQVNIQSLLQDVLSTGRLQLARSNGKFVIITDFKQLPVLKTLDETDIINSTLSINMPSSNDIANSITVNYVNPDDSWQKADYTIEDADLINYDGVDINKSLDIKGCISGTQAALLAELTLNSMRYSEDEFGNRLKQTPVAVSFATTTKHSDIEVGDVVAIDHFLLDRVRKFIILSVETDQSGIVSFSGREYCETHYKDASGNYII